VSVVWPTKRFWATTNGDEHNPMRRMRKHLDIVIGMVSFL
jgi:hypothetical protein